MSLIEQLSNARVFDLEQPRFAGMPVHPAHKPRYFYGLSIGVIAIRIGRMNTVRDPLALACQRHV